MHYLLLFFIIAYSIIYIPKYQKNVYIKGRCFHFWVNYVIIYLMDKCL